MILSGVDKLIRQMGGMDEFCRGGRADAALAAAYAAMARQIRDAARALVHSVTGLLHDSIRVHTKNANSPDRPLEVEVGVSYARTRAHHAHLVEGGHGGPHPARAHPFMAPAIESLMGQTQERLEAAVVDAVRRKFR